MISVKYLRLIALTVSAVVGAGFLTGVELVTFFGGKEIILPLVGSTALYAMFAFCALWLGGRYGGFYAFLRGKFQRLYPAVFTSFFVANFCAAASLTASINAVLSTDFFLAQIAFLLGASAVSGRGVKVVSVLSLALTPLLLFFVVFKSVGGLSFHGFWDDGAQNGWLVYAGYNGFLSFPILCEAGGSCTKRQSVPVSIAASAIIFALALLILGKISYEGANAYLSEAPFFTAVGGRVFPFVCAVGIFLSLSSCLFSLFSATKCLKGYQKTAEAVMLTAVFALSRLGLSTIVSQFYPVFGVFGLLFLAFCIFHEQFFKQDDQKVHSCGKHA